MSPRDYTEYEQTLSMLLDGTLNAPQMQALQDKLQADPGFRRFYLEHMKIHTLLRGELEGRLLEGLPADIEGIQALQADEQDTADALPPQVGPAITHTPDPVPYAGRPGQRRHRPNTFRLEGIAGYLSIAAGLLIVAATLFWAAQQAGSQGPTLARVTDSRGAYWDKATGGLGTNPKELSAGQYDLRVGQLELTFADGTTATLDAPANFILNSEDHLHLARGRVYVIAEEGSSGFQVSTPYALAVDLGTEFGVRFDPGSPTQVHVFKGEVDISETEFDALGNPASVGESLKLVENQAGHVTHGAGPALDQAADISLFVRRISKFAQGDEQASRLKAWRAYRKRISTDPDLVAAYDFTYRGRSSTTLPNIAYSTGRRLDGVLGESSVPDSAPVWTSGRFPKSGALLFTPSLKQFVELPSDEALKIDGDLTTVWWMMPRSTIHRDFSMVIIGYGGPRADHAPETAHENHMYAHGLKLGRIRAFHEAGQGDNQEALATHEIKPDTWTHVAIVRDTQAQIYHVYLNGELTDSLAYQQNANGGDSPQSFAAIGRSGGARLNHYDGKLDELLIFSRSLSEAEVKDLYQRSRPQTP